MLIGIIIFIAFCVLMNRIIYYFNYKSIKKQNEIINEKISNIKIGSKWNCFKQNNPFEDKYYAIVIDIKSNIDNKKWIKYNYYSDNSVFNSSEKGKPTRFNCAESGIDFVSHFPFEDKLYKQK